MTVDQIIGLCMIAAWIIFMIIVAYREEHRNV